ncbi:MAG: NADH-quinone oxidoreductase subunit C [Thermoplasmata archaeon]
MAEAGGARGFEERVVEGLRGLGDAILDAAVQRPRRLLARVAAGRIREVCGFLKSIGFDHLSCLTCVDYETELEVVYHLWSYGERCLIELRTRIDGAEPVIDSVAPVWMGAEFHEREAYDMFGVRFNGCPNLTRVLLPEEWTVFPLRKSFKIESIHEKGRRTGGERAGGGGAPGAPPSQTGRGGEAAAAGAGGAPVQRGRPEGANGSGSGGDARGMEG